MKTLRSNLMLDVATAADGVSPRQLDERESDFVDIRFQWTTGCAEEEIVIAVGYAVSARG